MRMCAGAAALLAAAASCTPAKGHSRLVGFDASPGQLRLDFSEGVEPKLSSVSVICGGREVARAPLRAVSAKSLEAALDDAPAGVCAAKWRAVSVDGHRTQGAFSFTRR